MGHRRQVIGSVIVLMLGLGACGDDGFDRDGVVREISESSGLSTEAAECIVDGLVDEYGEELVASNEEPTDDEIEFTRALTVRCANESG